MRQCRLASYDIPDTRNRGQRSIKAVLSNRAATSRSVGIGLMRTNKVAQRSSGGNRVRDYRVRRPPIKDLPLRVPPLTGESALDAWTLARISSFFDLWTHFLFLLPDSRAHTLSVLPDARGPLHGHTSTSTRLIPRQRGHFSRRFRCPVLFGSRRAAPVTSSANSRVPETGSSPPTFTTTVLPTPSRSIFFDIQVLSLGTS